MNPKRRGVRSVFAAAVGTGALVIGLPAATAAPAYPNLVSDPPEGPVVEDHTSGDGTRRLLLRFDGFVHNAGSGALELRGNPQSGGLQQRVFDPVGPTTDLPPRAPVVYETNDQHNHWHLMRASEYSLWDVGRNARVAPAEKVGFCLYDIERIESSGPTRPFYNDPTFCRQSTPSATSLLMGVSAGWRDVYDRSLALQWVDVSTTAPGEYVLASRTDPDDAIVEANEADNGYGFSPDRTIVPGHRAEPVGPVAVSGPGADITLLSSTYSAPTAPAGPRLFRVVQMPSHGTLSRALGETFASDTVHYVPSPGYRGPDSFGYVAVDAQSPFPRVPPTATASVQVDAPLAQAPIEISGAPASLIVGTSAQLTASGVTGGAVTWTVDGTVGGTAQSGTVTRDGLYVAPARVPPPGRAVIRAVSAGGAQPGGEVTIAIVDAPVSRPAPAPTATATGGLVTAGGGRMKTRLLLRSGSIGLLVSPDRSGVLRVAVMRRGTTAVSCTAFVTARRTLLCTRRVKGPVRRSDLRIVVREVGRAKRPDLGRVRVDVRDGYLTARVVTGRAGTVRLRVTRRTAVVLACRARVPAGRTVTCSTPIGAKDPAVRSLRASASLFSGALRVTSS